MSRATVAARAVSVAAYVACLLILGGCIRFWTTGADSLEDLQAELRYKEVYAVQIAKVHAAIQLFAPTESSPGVCNAGGNKQRCYEADAEVIRTFRAMRDALAATPVPPRFANADKLLREAIEENIRGLELRNRAIAESDNEAWDEHKVVLDDATAMIREAYAAYPEDNRPQPAP